MKYHDYLTACAIMHKVDLIEKAMEYMETVPMSTDCYNAIIDMLKYEKEGLIDNFKKIECVCDYDDDTRISKPVTRDDLEFNC